MTSTHTAKPLPGTLELGLLRGVAELRQFFRQREQVVFTFALPVLLMLLLGNLIGGASSIPGVSSGQLLAAGMIGAGIISTSFSSMGVGLTANREDGTLKRLHGTPMTATSFFLGKIILVAVTSLAEVVLMVGLAVPIFDLKLPSDPTKWLTLFWVFALGIIGCALMGIFVSSVVKSTTGAVALINLVYLCLQFISGVFVTPITNLPKVMVDIASFFPVKWICQGFRSVFLPEQAAAYEMAGKWELGTVALVLGAWCVVGLVLCRLVFRWTTTER
ncbi:MAG: transporter [Amycolatopsis sp.]|jgi:ABC-2 type transport system permease protein|uniref:ABC transporter permease n=1 Tax=Amycolatopsis sp. TaxID=37632 RepID=UPI0026217DB8|nr:ABC transporter permease [Amycolatopsis sp.]MCU1684898.1 transporter [Amycolatopsis sp.]